MHPPKYALDVVGLEDPNKFKSCFLSKCVFDVVGLEIPINLGSCFLSKCVSDVVGSEILINLSLVFIRICNWGEVRINSIPCFRAEFIEPETGFIRTETYCVLHAGSE